MKSYELIEGYDEDTVLMCWTHVPIGVIKELPSTYLINMRCIREDGKLEEETFVCLSECSPRSQLPSFDLSDDIRVYYDNFLN